MLDIDLPQLLYSLIGSGLLIGIWQEGVKPRRERKAMRAALRAEILHAISYMAVHLRNPKEHRGHVPPDFKISTTLFQALAPRLGELETGELAQLITIYRQFDELGRIPAIYQGHLDAARASDPVGAAEQLEEAATSARTFYSMLTDIHQHARQILDHPGNPDASSRRLQLISGPDQGG